jgi:hypothetical protein
LPFSALERSFGLFSEIAHMKKTDTMVRKCGRGTFAILLALVGLAIELPNMGHFVNDPTTRFVTTFRDQVFLYAGLLIPLVCIFVGMFRASMLEYIGWALLIIVFVGCLG